MPSSTLSKFNSFTHELGKGTHNFTTHTFKAALTNSAPAAANTVLANITQISAGGGYTAGGYTLDGIGWTTASGLAKLVITDEVIVAAGGNVGPFRYIVLYNDTAANDELIGWLDYGSSITLQDGESITLDFDGTNGVLTIQ